MAVLLSPCLLQDFRLLAHLHLCCTVPKVILKPPSEVYSGALTNLYPQRAGPLTSSTEIQ